MPPLHSDAQRLCELLAELMLANDPKARTAPESKAWQDPMRLLIDKDGRTPEEVERLIGWSQADEFWRTNILSPAKLRKQAGQLKLKMEASGLRSAIEGRPPPSSAQLGAAFASPADRASRTGRRS